LGRVSAPPHDVRVVLILHPFEKGATLDHSIGLMRGQMAVVNAFADPKLMGLLRVVLTHELLHVAGATDKYDAQGHPLYPDGYADPSQPRTVDQKQAALMAGSIPLADGSVRLPRSLKECVIKPQTAREIGWILPNEAP